MDTKAGAQARKPTFYPRRARKKAGTPMTNPPLTPLIDVFLFLIIFFLLSCQFHQYEGTIPANLPKTGTGLEATGEVALQPVRVTLTPDGEKTVKIRMSGPVLGGARDVETMLDLYGNLADLRARHGAVAQGLKRPIIIHPVPGVRWGFVVDAFNQAVRAGFTEVGVAPSHAPTS